LAGDDTDASKIQGTGRADVMRDRKILTLLVAALVAIALAVTVATAYRLYVHFHVPAIERAV
jgi:hypothetical protein